MSPLLEATRLLAHQGEAGGSQLLPVAEERVGGAVVAAAVDDDAGVVLGHDSERTAGGGALSRGLPGQIRNTIFYVCFLSITIDLLIITP